jgi:precorrin-2 dehydrogenase/sirohydrochlorin ferrochelatase
VLNNTERRTDESPAFFPLFVDLCGKTVLVAGGGAVAERKILQLKSFGAAVKAVSPRFTDILERAGIDGTISVYRRPYNSSDMAAVTIAVAATGDRAVNQRIHDDAVAQSVPVNVVDNPALCTFYFPSIVRRGPLVAGVSTSGRYPLMAQSCRLRLEKEFPPEYGLLTEMLGAIRDRLLATDTDRTAIHALLDRLLNYSLSLVSPDGPTYTDEEIRQQLAGWFFELSGQLAAPEDRRQR